MAEEGGDGQEKTEEPTPKRRQQAREDGQIITSKETFVFVSMAGAVGLLALAFALMPRAASAWAGYFRFDGIAHLDSLIAGRTVDALVAVVMVTLAAGLPLAALTLFAQAATGGLNFAPKALGLKMNKLDPLKGMQRMISMRSLVELVKAVLKVTLLIGAAAAIMIPQLPILDRLVFSAPGDALDGFGVVLLKVLGAQCAGLLLIGGIDLAYQVHSHGKKLRMSRQEIKDEAKQTEGSPEVKGQIRRRQIEASRKGARRRKALEDVPNATSIVTNPTHFAVALRYEPGKTDAPVIVAMGDGAMAHRIMAIGQEAGVHVLRVPLLARALYFTGEIGREITPELYVAVAAIEAHVYRLNQGLDVSLPDIEVPSDLRFDETGHPLKGTRT
ncbi:flagellar biosynthetic protein FlhB [Rhodovulum bhavnagarense]|uniref:Flagellar biosynthetic protein FlhB n=1 Tax=Rhodovulum bhavnagarense TaxID=992286 RepID=A0A4R2RNL6_9RHOB|nr:EscU/YscU/HrcU family type III secretion system export apparatus switch protein [Rhodovulum bhavnagarense]TCP61391.1 flagellar biosynthetic protein FlhB [Rhodovulum bhavnagarense]